MRLVLKWRRAVRTGAGATPSPVTAITSFFNILILCISALHFNVEPLYFVTDECNTSEVRTLRGLLGTRLLLSLAELSTIRDGCIQRELTFYSCPLNGTL